MTTKTLTGSTTQAPTMEQQRPHAKRVHDAWSPGDVAHQGDLIIVALGALPKSAKPRTNRQLAEGDSRGSRHELVGGECYDADPKELAGLIASATGGKVKVDPKYVGACFSGAAVIDHPQHAAQEFPDQPCSVVVFQRNLDAEEREQRQQD